MATGKILHYEQTNTSNNINYNHIFDDVQIIGHRTNSLSKFQEYKNNGLKFIEADITITSDNVPLLSHDDLFVISDTNYYISRMTYSAIVNTGATFDTLENLLKNCKRYNIALYLDIKNGTTTNIVPLYNLVQNYGMLDMTVFGTIYSSPEIVNLLGGMNSSLIFDYRGNTSSTVDEALTVLPPCALILMHYDVGSSNPTSTIIEAVKYGHQKGVKSYMWTVDSESVANAYYNIGADYVMSNILTNVNEGWSRVVSRTYVYDNVTVGKYTSLVFTRDIAVDGLYAIGVVGNNFEDGSSFDSSVYAGCGWGVILDQGTSNGTNVTLRISNNHTTKPLLIKLTLTILYGTNY